MYGLVFITLESFVLKNYGEEAWHAVKEKAKCDVEDGQFIRRQCYPDGELVDLAVAAAELLKTPLADVLEAFGRHWYHQMYEADGHKALLDVNGSTLRTWFSSLNAMHDHIQKSFIKDDFNAPIFWCEDYQDEEVGNVILLHYCSVRVDLLLPFVEGVVSEIATCQFGVEIAMDIQNIQGENDALFTTWKLSAIDPTQSYKLTPQGKEVEEENLHGSFSECPFTGQAIKANGEEKSGEGRKQGSPFSTLPTDMVMSLVKLQSLFPFHIMVDSDFVIRQVGRQLPSLMNKKSHELLGEKIGDVVEISRPVLGCSWDWNALHKLSDQVFFMVPTRATKKNGNRRVSISKDIQFKSSMVKVPVESGNENLVMFCLTPDATSVEELQAMGLTIPDLPLHSSHRDVIMLGEYIDQEVRKAHTLDNLSRELDKEKHLSNTLLYNMLPKNVADDLRRGKTVQPVQHDNVTLFFSDIVGFTSICDQVTPWDVIDMLNQLYCVMDHLSAKFGLYKVETIGDAYMCCSGLPEDDPLHAENTANFAIAVMNCVRHVKSPVDDTMPINLRIGIHTGQCTAGVVGTLTPHYCLFGDMVNVTARHESTGVAGKIQASSDLFGKLTHFSSYETEQYNWTPRGLVDMKGKGERYTYFLDGGTDDNAQVNPKAIEQLYHEVGEMLEQNTWKKRHYFHRGSLREGSVLSSEMLDMSDSSNDAEPQRARESPGVAPREKNPGGVPKPTSAGLTAAAPSDTNAAVLPKPASVVPAAGSDNGSTGSTQHTRDTVLSGSDIAPAKQTKESKAQPGWASFVWDESLSQAGLVAVVYDFMSPLLKGCLASSNGGHLPPTTELVDGQLYGFVQHVSKMFRNRNSFHNFRRSVHEVVWCDHLMESIQRCQKKAPEAQRIAGNDPWLRLVLAFAALLRGCKHSGISGEQLQKEGHMVYLLHGEDTLCQVRYSLSSAVNVLEENYPNLSHAINLGFPSFLFLLRKMALCKEPLGNLTKVVAVTENGVTSTERTAAIGTAVLKLGSMGHFALNLDDFADWNEAQLKEKRIACLAKRGPNPTPTWADDCANMVRCEALPIIKQLKALSPEAQDIEDAFLRNEKAI